MPKNLPGPGDAVAGYQVVRLEALPHVDGTYLELVHTATGGRHIHIACPDDNKTFGMAFPTLPTDSTGVAHILEHVVLSGSKRFPVRDAFFSMVPRSLKTFMNALTGGDRTAYPFSTRNEKDFFNLLSVYLDATFFPRIEEDSFKQEGHRFEFEDPTDPNSPLILKGVVFNEMKGAMASPPSAMGYALGRALFPGLPYQYNSGGDPLKIPDLTWHQLREFHARHYHPSNSYCFTYGDLSLEKVLTEIESQAFSSFERVEIDTTIPDVKRFTEPTRYEAAYAVPANEPLEKKAQSLVAWATARASSSTDILGLTILEEVLLGNPSSYLQKALIDSGLGDALADGSGLLSHVREAIFAAGLKGIDTKDSDAVEAIVLSTLQGLVDKGIEQERVEAAIHQVEFDQREVSNAGAPYGLRLMFRLLRKWLDGGDAHRALLVDQDLAEIDALRQRGPYFQDLIGTWMIDNPHRVRIDLVPDPELEARNRELEEARLRAIQAGLTDEEKSKIVQDAVRLKASQEAKQDVSSLPTLELSDIPMEFDDVQGEARFVGSNRTVHFALPTNGISYVDIRASFIGLDDGLKSYLPLFATAVSKVGAAGADYTEVAKRIARYTGGLGANISIRTLANEEGFLESFTLSGKALARNHAPFVEILRDLLASVEFEPKRLADVIGQTKAQRLSGIVMNGGAYARMLACSKLSPQGALEERLQGMSYVGLLKRLSEDDMAAEAAVQLSAIKDHLFRATGLEVCVTSDGRDEEGLLALLGGVLGAIPSEPVPAHETPVAVPEVKHEARTTASPVAFNARSFKTPGYTHPDAPALSVLANFMKSTYLHRELREKGGAYGSAATFDPEDGLFTLGSSRDPNIVRTYQVFEDAVSEVMKGQIDPDDLKEAVLSVCGALDPLESPDTKGRRKFFSDLAGYTLERRREFKAAVLGVTEADLRRVAEQHLATNSRMAMATVGGPQLVEQANAEMGGIFEISPV